MKKILYILVFSLLFCNNGIANGIGKPECLVEGKEYPERLLTLPVACY